LDDGILSVTASALWLMLPAYIANPTAAFFGGERFGKVVPLDMGKTIHGKRILGDGKTVRGTASGLACGILTAVLQTEATRYLGTGAFVAFPPAAMICMPAGALLGDMAKSFLKRRLGYERGAALLLADQLDFVAGAWALTYIFARGWFEAVFSFPVVIVVLIVTPLLHRLTNKLGYMIKVKKEPW